MKLKTSQTIRVGFAFLSICAFWQMYDGVIPRILTETFGIGETVSGVIMSLDNVLALFLLPFFGGLSDRCRSRMGKRKPFILCGTVVAVFLMLLLPFLDNMYYAEPSIAIKVTFIVILGCILVAMGSYRSPAVALMPDVTPKPLRSKGNAIINLMGTIGGILYLGITSVLYSQKRVGGLEHVDYFPLFAIVAGIMVVSLCVIMFAVNEVKLSKEVEDYEKEHPEENLMEVTEDGKEKLPKEVKRSLVFILCSIALWFIGYNAVTTWFTSYAKESWNMTLGQASTCLTIANIGAILAYIPIGAIASRVGRRKTIIAGVGMLSGGFLAAFLYTLFFDKFSYGLFVLFLIVGVAWAAINVNSLPMVLEMCKGNEVGKFTGLYYTFSMSAQIVTPIVAGALIEHVSMKSLFLYSAIFSGLAILTMLQVKHGDNKITAKKGLEAFDVED